MVVAIFFQKIEVKVKGQHNTSNMSVGNLSIFGEFLSHFYPKYLSAVAMVTGMCRDERSVDCLVLCHNKHSRKVSAKSATMRATALCKDLSGYRELLLSHYYSNAF